MRKILKYSLVALVAVVSAMATSLAVGTPAHAYDDGLWQWTSMNTGNCATTGGYHHGAHSSGDYCVLGGVSYRKDSGGIALLAEFTPNYCCGGEKAFRVEWHPNGEHLKVCDLAGDGDTIYAKLGYKSYNWYWKSVVNDTSAGCTDANYSFVEGTEIKVALYDDKSTSDWMATYYNLRG